MIPRLLGDIQQLQWELHRRDHERTTLIDEVSNLTAKMEELNSIAKNYEMLQRQYDELLQMYGEKDEAYRELKMDMEDIKEIHKLQVSETKYNSSHGPLLITDYTICRKLLRKKKFIGI